MSGPLNRTKFSAIERNFRSRIVQLSSSQWVLRGTLSERSGTSGKANCRCGPAPPVLSSAGHLAVIARGPPGSEALRLCPDRGLQRPGEDEVETALRLLARKIPA
jgi:hypothetical protein